MGRSKWAYEALVVPRVIEYFQCFRFDDRFLDAAIFRSNANYGALDPETTNVIYVHGSIDPWHALGLTTSVHPQMPAIYIEGKALELTVLHPEHNALFHHHQYFICEMFLQEQHTVQICTIHETKICHN